MTLASRTRARAARPADSPAHAESHPSALLRIAPPGRWPSVDLRELWTYRGLFFFLVWRDVKARYSQTVLGAGWAVLQPLLSMGVFTVVFGRLARMPSEGVPYAIFSLAALVPWTYFASALTASSASLVVNRALVTKVYFPRLVIPSAPIFAALVDFGIAFAMLLLVMLGFGIVPRPAALIAVPLAVLVAAMTALGVGAWLAALHIQYRDVHHLTPFLVQVWLFASPIVYPTSLVPVSVQPFFAFNPMTGVVTAFRSTLLGTAAPVWSTLFVSLAAAAVLLLAGTLYFRHAERLFADVA
jgi:lipopolysaccharide transport system permease protein